MTKGQFFQIYVAAFGSSHTIIKIEKDVVKSIAEKWRESMHKVNRPLGLFRIEETLAAFTGEAKCESAFVCTQHITTFEISGGEDKAEAVTMELGISLAITILTKISKMVPGAKVELLCNQYEIDLGCAEEKRPKKKR